MASEARQVQHGARLSLRLRSSSDVCAEYDLELVLPVSRWHGLARLDAGGSPPHVHWNEDPGPQGLGREQTLIDPSTDPALVAWLRLLLRSIHQRRRATGRWPQHTARWRNPCASPRDSRATSVALPGAEEQPETEGCW